MTLLWLEYCHMVRKWQWAGCHLLVRENNCTCTLNSRHAYRCFNVRVPHVPFPPWMATASTPFSSRYSWIASTSAFFSANMSTCQHKCAMSQRLLWFIWHLPAFTNIKNCSQGETFSGDTRADTPSWPPLWRIRLPTNTVFIIERLLTTFKGNYIKVVWGMGTNLNDVQASSTGPSHVDGDGLDQCTLGKVLDLLRHSGTVKQGLSLSL